MATITSAQTGLFSEGTTWVGGVKPSAVDDFVIAGTHTVTIDAPETNLGGVVSATGTLINNSTLTLNGGLTLTGEYTTGPGSVTTFNGNFDITYGGDTGVLSSTANASSYAIIEAAPTFGFSVQGGFTQKIEFLPRYTILRRMGRSDLNADHALLCGSNNKSSIINPQYCLFTDYWRFRFGAGWDPAVDAVFRFDNCDFRNPLISTISEYTCATNFNAGTRGWVNCTFVASATNRTINLTNAGTAYTNPVLFNGCIGEDIFLNNLNGCPMDIDLVTRDVDYAVSGGNNLNIASSGAGGWNVHDTLIVSTKPNSHTLQVVGTGPTAKGTVQDCIVYNLNNADNAILWNQTTDLLRNITIDGNGYVNTSANTGLVLIDRATHIHHNAPNADSLLIFETNNYGANQVTVQNSIQLGLNINYSINNIAPAIQDIAYTDYNCWYQVGLYYNRITVANNTLAEGVDEGFGLYDIEVNANMRDALFKVSDWDNLKGGPGTVDNAFTEMLKLNGFDRSGSPASFNTAYTKDDLLTTARTAFTPTNPALRGTGRNGSDIGALPVMVIMTKPVNDCKYNVLLRELGVTSGHINDLELAWLHSLIVSATKAKHINDAWMQYWDEQLVPSGHYNDRAFTWLTSVGAAGQSITDKWAYFWCITLVGAT